MFLNFISQGHERFSRGQRSIQRSIKKVRFWQDREPIQWKRAEDEFNYNWKIATPLDTYLGSTTKPLTLGDLLKGKMVGTAM